MDLPVGQRVIEDAEKQFKHVSEHIASHTHVLNEQIYPQPSTYLTTHYICMQLAGFYDIDFDTLAAISGASALFAYFPGDFMPKYAHLHIGISKRIEEATGFGWERSFPDSPDACFDWIVESVESGRPVRGTFYEEILFAGYQADKKEKKVFVMSDGADYYAHWFGWKDFSNWFRDWNEPGIGRYSGRKEALRPEEIQKRFLKDLVEWADHPPGRVVNEYPGARFGLQGIKQYAVDCADTYKYSDWSACHDINPQWSVRRSTALYLERIAVGSHFKLKAGENLITAAKLFHKAYGQWREFYKLLGHGAPDENGTNRKIRSRASECIFGAYELERDAIAILRPVVESK